MVLTFPRRREDGMQRRAFIAGLGSAAAWPLVARGQDTRRRRVIGGVGGASRDAARPQRDAFIQGLRELGYIEGTDFEFLDLWANGEMHRLPELAQAVVRLNPDVIFAAPTPAAVAAKAASTSIPIVCFMLADEVRLGLVASDARPGGNVTGIAMRLEGMAGKQFELASEVFPGTKKIGVLANVASSDAAAQLRDVDAASAALKVDCVAAEVHKPDELETAVQHLAAE